MNSYPNSILPHGLKTRMYYFLIWGHGLKDKDGILNMIRKHDGLDIVFIANHAVRHVKTFVKQVYSHDYAPFRHLKRKTRYLLNTPPKIMLIVVKNNSPDINFLGENKFRHEECCTIKQLKEDIRDRYNPQENGKRSEHHVVHASDNPHQLKKLLQVLNYKDDYAMFTRTAHPNVSTPFYVPKTRAISFKSVFLNELYASVLTETANGVACTLTPLDKTPHYYSLSEDFGHYKKYLDTFFGSHLKSNYSVEKFQKLSQSFCYLEGKHHKDFIIAEKLKPNTYRILDGFHRATILQYRKIKKAIIGVINE